MVETQSRKRVNESSSGKNLSMTSMEKDNDIENNHRLSGELNSNIETGSRSDQNMFWWYKDRNSILLLFFLYVLQGIPLGLAGSIPMLLASRTVDYKQQALFSFVFWPFSLKLLWAPIVDGAYISSFGRRKSWLVPVQYCIAGIMFLLSQRLHDMLEVPSPNVWNLTVCFFILNFCAATQDIAVDGWALTMLSKKNVGLASTCNSVGQTAGFFLGYTVFLALESADFCNKYLRTVPHEYGIVTLAGFMYFWSIVFFLTTTLVMVFKHEYNQNADDDDDNESEGVFSTYKQLWKIICLPSVLQYVIILLTCKVAFASEQIVGLKLIECGINKESLALLAIPLTPLQILLPLLIAKYTTGPRPLDLFLRGLKYRSIFTLVFALVVHWTPRFKQADGSFPYYYFVGIVVIYCFHQVTLYSMFVSVMSFNAKISDPRIGGTYMTLLNTVANLGGNWPSTLALWYVDTLTYNTCVNGSVDYCTKDTKEACLKSGGRCDVTVDGYYVEAVFCFFIGVLWLLWKARSARRLQELGPESWKCST